MLSVPAEVADAILTHLRGAQRRTFARPLYGN